MLSEINKKMHDGNCPTAGCLGECAAIFHTRTSDRAKEIYEAYVYLWDDNFTDWEKLAQWFTEQGAEEVHVAWVMYDSANGDRDGRTEYGARAVVVTYVVPKEDMEEVM